MQQPDHSEQLRSGLGAAAQAIDPGDPTASLADVHATVGRRRQRRRGVAGVAAVGALAVGGVLVANVARSNGDDMIVSAPATDPVEETVPVDTSDAEAADTTVAEPVDTTANDAPPPAEAVGTLEVRPSRLESVDTDAFIVAEREYVDVRLFPWQDGFLAVSFEQLPQPLPAELPAEITDQFPQEVRDLFPDGLPATIEEATQQLEDAGLYDVLSEIVVSNPDVMESIYASAPSVEITSRFSADGVEWNDVDLALPVDSSRYPTFSSTGDRLVVVVPVPADEAEPFGRPAAVDVWSTTDLVDWAQQTIDLPPAQTDLPDFFDQQVFVSEIATNDGGWVLSVESYTQIDPLPLLDEEQRAATMTSGYGTSTSDTGITIELFDETEGDSMSEVSETIEFTWEELGVADAPEEEFGSTLYTASWGGEAQVTEPTVDGQRGYGWGQVVAFGDGFVTLGDDLRLSADGVQWSPVQLPTPGYVEWVIDSGDGLVVSGRTEDGERFTLLFDPATSEFAAVDLGDLPEWAGRGQAGRNFVELQDYGEDTAGGLVSSGGVMMSADVDGYRFELVTNFSETDEPVSYTLVDVASGEVVLTEALTSIEGDFEFLQEDEETAEFQGFRLYDPATGDELLAVGFDELTYVSLDEAGEPIPESATAFESEIGSEQFATWIVAGVDGSLVVEELGDLGEFQYLASAAVQGDVVLVAGNDGSLSRIVAES